MIIIMNPPAAQGRSTLWILIAANIFLIAQVLYFDLDLFALIFLFWAETFIIGIFNIPKIICFHKRNAAAMVPFFIFHFGVFMFAHISFLILIFKKQIEPTGIMGIPLNMDNMFVLINHYIHILIWSLVGLFISHGYSFIKNYISKKEYLNTDEDNDPFVKPYGRVAVTHIVILIAGVASMLIGANTIAILVVAMLKIIFDGWAHVREHAPKTGYVSLFRRPNIFKNSA